MAETTTLFFILMKKISNNKGFTLLEILMAVMIFGIVMTTLFFSYKSIFKAREKIEEKIKLVSEARSAISRIHDDIVNFYCETRPLYKESNEIGFKSKYFFRAESDFDGGEKNSRLDFTSYSHLGFGDNHRSPVNIFYYVKENILYRGDFIYPYPEKEEIKEEKSYKLCRNIKSFKFYFYDKDENEYEFWDSDEEEYQYSTPYIVKIQLEIKIYDETEKIETEIKIPVYRKPKK